MKNGSNAIPLATINRPTITLSVGSVVLRNSAKLNTKKVKNDISPHGG